MSGTVVWYSARHVFRSRRQAYKTSSLAQVSKSPSASFSSSTSLSSSSSPPSTSSSSLNAQQVQNIPPSSNTTQPSTLSHSKLTPFAAVYPFSYPRSFTSASHPAPSAKSHDLNSSSSTSSSAYPNVINVGSSNNSLPVLLSILSLPDLILISQRFLHNVSSLPPNSVISISQSLILAASRLQVFIETEINQQQKLVLELTNIIAQTTQVEEQTFPGVNHQRSRASSLYTEESSSGDSDSAPPLKQGRFNREYSVDDLLLDSLPTVEEEKNIQEGRKEVHEGAAWTKRE